MERPVKGDVIVLPFPYTNLSTTKRRPALVVANLKGDNVILAQITTKKRNDPDLIELRKSDFSEGNLEIDSFIMPSILFTAEITTIEYKSGRLKDVKVKEVETRLCEIFTR